MGLGGVTCGWAGSAGGMSPGESPGRKRGNSATVSVNHASVVARRQAKRWGAEVAGIDAGKSRLDIHLDGEDTVLPDNRDGFPAVAGWFRAAKVERAVL